MKYKVGDLFYCENNEHTYIVFKVEEVEEHKGNPLIYLRDMKSNQTAPFYTNQLDGFYFYKHISAE
mgnify:FL=1